MGFLKFLILFKSICKGKNIWWELNENFKIENNFFKNYLKEKKLMGISYSLFFLFTLKSPQVEKWKTK